MSFRSKKVLWSLRANLIFLSSPSVTWLILRLDRRSLQRTLLFLENTQRCLEKVTAWCKNIDYVLTLGHNFITIGCSEHNYSWGKLPHYVQTKGTDPSSRTCFHSIVVSFNAKNVLSTRYMTHSATEKTYATPLRKQTWWSNEKKYVNRVGLEYFIRSQ